MPRRPRYNLELRKRLPQLQAALEKERTMTPENQAEARERQPPPDLIAVYWAESLSQGEQDVLLTSSLRRLQKMINVALLQQPTTSERYLACVRCGHLKLEPWKGTCEHQVFSKNGEPCSCKCVYPATGAPEDEYVSKLQRNYTMLEDFVREVKEILNLHGPTPDILGELRKLVAATGAGEQRDLLAEAIADAATKAGIIESSQSLTGPQLLMLCDDLATAAIRSLAEREFITASVAVWRELDKRKPYTSANALDAATELRKREQAAWEQYRDELVATSPAPVAEGEPQSTWMKCEDDDPPPSDGSECEYRACSRPRACFHYCSEHHGLICAPTPVPATEAPRGERVPEGVGTRGGEATEDPAMQAEFSDGDGRWDIPRMADTIVELRARPSTVTTSEAAREASLEIVKSIYPDDLQHVRAYFAGKETNCGVESVLNKIADIISKHLDTGEVEQLTRELVAVREDQVYARTQLQELRRYRDQCIALLNPTSADESLDGAIRNLQQAYITERDNAVEARANAIREAVEKAREHLANNERVKAEISPVDGLSINRYLHYITEDKYIIGTLQSLLDKKEEEDGR